MISKLKRRFGPFCTGIKVNYEKEFVNSPLKTLRFCEAVNDSFHTPILFNPENLSCLGSKRSLGIFNNDDDLIQHISQESQVIPKTVKYVLDDTPILDTPVENILLGISEEMEKEVQPDMYIMYILPKNVMNLMKEYTLKLNKFPVIKPYTFLSVCGNIFVRTYRFGVMSASYGCPESRKYGGVKDNLVVVGIPYDKCLQLFG